jgi:hypothetical protein
MQHPTMVRVMKIVSSVAALAVFGALALGALGALGACDKKEAPQPPPTAGAAAASVTTAANTGGPQRTKVVIPNVVVAGKGTTKVHVAWKLPAGTGVNDGAPFRVRWTSSEGLEHAPEDMHAKGADVEQGFDVQVTPTAGAPSALLAGDVDVVVCDVATHRVCVPVTRRIEMTFLAEGSANAANVTVPLPEARPQG